MAVLEEVVELCSRLDSLSTKTRHANFQIVPAMYYDNVSVPTLRMRQDIEEAPFDTDCWDYVRFRTLELLAQEIDARQLDGDIAEAGVYQGNFAYRMNTIFPDKKLHLFDTFSGFLEDDIELERKKDLVSNEFLNSIDQYASINKSRVLDAMPNPAQCVVHQGDIAHTSKNTTETFCLVSVDMDFYKPTYEALCNFYQQLVPHGYLVVHDYNHDDLRGVKAAVHEFREMHPDARAVPLSDQCGSIVIVK